MFKTISIQGRKVLSRWPWIINIIDRRPNWARVLEAVQYERYVDQKTSYNEIGPANAHPLGLSVQEYKDSIEFLDDHGLIDFPPQGESTHEGVTHRGFEWIRDRQRTKSQAKRSRATSKLTLALVIVSTITLLNLSGWHRWVALFVLGYLGLTVIYDITVRDY